ncbi:hypothetical protein M8J71_13375 [Pseudarthrobacter sp. R1]|nr:hypothetical protein [Pseudarthrobacter sp. R1]MCQ6271470.1 hypothetical protein [Pseudarthrobacter sp. R1]
MLGVYTVNNSLFDMFLVIIFGIIGYILKGPVLNPAPWCSRSCWVPCSK